MRHSRVFELQSVVVSSEVDPSKKLRPFVCWNFCNTGSGPMKCEYMPVELELKGAMAPVRMRFCICWCFDSVFRLEV